jgi:hypothetical protein
MTNKIVTLGLAALVGLGLTGCSKDEIVFDNKTSFGHTQIFKVNEQPFRIDDQYMIITNEDTTTTLYDCMNVIPSSKDYSKQDSDWGKVELNKNKIDNEILEYGIGVFCSRYSDMFYKVLEEAKTSKQE